ncbi:MAG: helix-turn-helix transcriptional regulator [Bacteroidetes bacterium]|nr:helix-turn-helix transcriptional regulator [Bacteroidota bacterium]
MALSEEKDFLIQLGKQIAKLRKKRGISQIELGYRCDFEKSNMRRIEAGRTNPTALTIRKISKALDVPLKKIFYFKI